MKTKSLLITFVVFAAFLLQQSSVVHAQTEGGFDWSTAEYDPTNGGYCNAAGWCAAPIDQLPPSWAQYCQSSWCAYPSLDAGFDLGLNGGLGGQGGSCDWSTDCYTTLPGVEPPPFEICVGPNCPPTNPTAIPASTSQPTAQPTAVPTLQPTAILSVECPPDLTISQEDPASTIVVEKLSPNFPVVVGQDPEKTGVTLSVGMTVPPVYVSYNVLREYTEDRCEWGGQGYPGDTCGGTKSSEWHIVQTILRRCERQTDTYVDRLRSLEIRADLAQASIDWINGELAARYPGAHVYQGNWRLFPDMPGIGGPSADLTAFAMQWERLQIRDPGKYIVNVQGATTGTPYTAPRPFAFSRETFSVDLIMVALTK